MAKKKKRNTHTPRRHRFNCEQRLGSARQWLSTLEDQHDSRYIARAYRKRYGVNVPTAFIELEMLEVEIDPDYKRNALASEQSRIEAKRKKRLAEAEAELEWADVDYDDSFAYIVGYTSGGAAYGLTWEEWAIIEAEEMDAADSAEAPF